MFVSSAIAEEKVIDISSTEAASYRAESVWSCCSPSYLGNINSSEILLRHCSTQGGYCNGSKGLPFFSFDLSKLPEDAVVENVRVIGSRQGSQAGSGYIKYGFHSNGSVSTSMVSSIDVSPVGEGNIYWSGTSFNYPLSTSVFNSQFRDSYCVIVFQHYSSTTSYILNSSTNGVTLRVTYELPCDGDVNDDGTIDSMDLGILLTYWGPNPTDGDINNDNMVDAMDLGLLLANWGPCP